MNGPEVESLVLMLVEARDIVADARDICRDATDEVRAARFNELVISMETEIAQLRALRNAGDR